MSAQLRLESLETRENPAADVYFDGPMLVINTDDAGDTAVVTEVGGLVYLNVNGVDFEPLPRAAIGLIAFYGNGGDDVFVNNTTALAYADGGFGDDIFVGGSGGNVFLGGVGDDILVGGIGNDYLLGDSGQDALFGGPGIDVIAGGTGVDVYYDADPLDAYDDSDLNAFDDFDV
jgi:Ca2+-binding RTX toxin-like protein